MNTSATEATVAGTVSPVEHAAATVPGAGVPAQTAVYSSVSHGAVAPIIPAGNITANYKGGDEAIVVSRPSR